MKYLLLFGLTLLVVGPATAQSKSLEYDSTLIKAAFTKQYPNVEAPVYKGLGSIQFEQDGDLHIVDYSKKGKWKRTYRFISFDRLPEAVQKSFYADKQSKHGAGHVSIHYMPKRDSIYFIDLNTRGMINKFLCFYPSGKKAKL